MDRFLDIAKALADQTRCRIVMMLDAAGEPLCLCQIIDVLGLAPSTVSQHLSMLTRAGLVERRKDGRWHFFTLNDAASADARQALQWVRASLAGDATVAADIAKWRGSCDKDRSELAACYRLEAKETERELLRIES